MPLERKVRPTSASGTLETQNVPSISNELGPGAGTAQQPWRKPIRLDTQGQKAPLDGLASFQPHDTADRGLFPEWLEQAILKKGHRSHSLALGEAATLTERHCSMDSMHSFYKLKVEQKVSLENLMKLKKAFEELENDGKKSLNETNFRQIIKNCLGLRGYNDQIQELFMKIDYLGNGKINWDQFCTYMQLEYTEKDESLSRSKNVAFTLPASVVNMSHSDPVLRIRFSPDGTVVTVRENGGVYYWSPELQIRKNKMVFQERPVNQKSKWATDFVIMPQYNKLIIGTGDREIQLYEISSLEPYCQVSALETVPLTMDYCYTGHDECAILYGDALGCVNIILMTLVGETLRTWKKSPKVEEMPSMALNQAVLSPTVKLLRWKVHEDWVNEVKYFKSIHTIISTSSHERTALVIGCMMPMTNLKQQMSWEEKNKKAVPSLGDAQQRTAWDQTVFSTYKGVKTFDFSHKHRLLITGGLDRLIRMWNPYVPSRPTGILKGHSAPIFYLCISEDDRIFSISLDNTVKIWDIHEQRCLFTAHPKASLLRGDVTACVYVQSVRALYVATDSMARLSLRTRPKVPSRRVVSHREPVLCCGYSKAFRQVVSGTEGSVVKVWDFDTGMQVFEFGEAHGSSAVTSMTFDPKGRRLVTGGRDGCLKAWNFNNGHCLKVFKKEGEDDEVCDCTYLTVNRKSYVVSVGWGRKVDIYIDSPEDNLHHIQNPQPPWPDDLRCGHRDDILCVAQCPPSLLASGSHDGEVIVWNLVSGHLKCRFLTPLPPDRTNSKDVDRSVLSILFLRTQTVNVEQTSAICLVSCGLAGFLNFWSILSGGKLLASFEASKMKRKVTKLAAAGDDTLLYVADEVGYIYVFDIETYALGPEQEDKGPKTVNYWRAHISTITSLQVVDRDKVLLTASTDCTVRLWTIHGEFIGTFGQPESWSIHMRASWKHPAVPYEILMDPLSMPNHPVLEGECNLDTRTEARDRSDLKAGAQGKLRYHLFTLTDRDIQEEINSFCYPVVHGKRLRHEIFKHSNKMPSHGGPKTYHSLKYFELADAPAACTRPDLSLAGTDPFISATGKELPEESQ